MALFSFPEQVNERAARLVASGVALTLLISLAMQWRWPIPILAVGFLLRVGWGPRFSPLARTAMWGAKSLWPAIPVSGPPKRFAQGIGAVCTVAATALLFSGHPALGFSLAGLVLAFAVLEAAFALCMGCWLYARLQVLGLFPADACTTCAPGSL